MFPRLVPSQLVSGRSRKPLDQRLNFCAPHTGIPHCSGECVFSRVVKSRTRPRSRGSARRHAPIAVGRNGGALGRDRRGACTLAPPIAAQCAGVRRKRWRFALRRRSAPQDRFVGSPGLRRSGSRATAGPSSVRKGSSIPWTSERGCNCVAACGARSWQQRPLAPLLVSALFHSRSIIQKTRDELLGPGNADRWSGDARAFLQGPRCTMFTATRGDVPRAIAASAALPRVQAARGCSWFIGGSDLASPRALRGSEAELGTGTWRVKPQKSPGFPGPVCRRVGGATFTRPRATCR